MSVLEGSADNEVASLRLKLDEREATRGVLQALSEILGAHPGPSEVTIYLLGGGKPKPFALPQRVRVSSELFAEIKFLLGMDCIMTEQKLRESLVEDLADGDEGALVVEESTLLGTE